MNKYKEFTRENGVNDWLSHNYGDFIQYVQDNIEHGKKDFPNVLMTYGGSWYKLINSRLRFDDRNSIDERDIEQDIRILIDGMSEYFVPEDIIVYRYIHHRVVKLLINHSLEQNRIVERGFMSTTLCPLSNGMLELIKRHKYNCLIKLYVPKGIPGVPIKFNDEQTYLNEYEFLFPPDLSLIVIKKYFSFKYLKMIYECKIKLDE